MFCSAGFPKPTFIFGIEFNNKLVNKEIFFKCDTRSVKKWNKKIM